MPGVLVPLYSPVKGRSVPQATDVELGFAQLFTPGFKGFVQLFHGSPRLRKKPDQYLFRSSGRTYHAWL